MTNVEIPSYLLALKPHEITTEIAIYEKGLAEAVEFRDTYEGSQSLCVDGYSWYDDECSRMSLSNCELCHKRFRFDGRAHDRSLPEAETKLAFVQRH